MFGDDEGDKSESLERQIELHQERLEDYEAVIDNLDSGEQSEATEQQKMAYQEKIKATQIEIERLNQAVKEQDRERSQGQHFFND